MYEGERVTVNFPVAEVVGVKVLKGVAVAMVGVKIDEGVDDGLPTVRVALGKGDAVLLSLLTPVGDGVAAADSVAEVVVNKNGV